ncbi:MAG: hypothetical protein FD167_1062 [bacterium]|nr:MAG: hypothetical protein FD167_1062 [bacterium]
MRNLKYEKVYGSWQEGIYPYFKASDVLKDKSEFIYWWHIESGYAVESTYWAIDGSRDLMPLFGIGLEDLEFLVERKEESGSIGYPKVISIGKIKDLIKPEILDRKECWEWVYVACQGYKNNEYAPGQKIEYLRLEPFASNSNSDFIWLISGETPIYRLRKRASFSRLESFYGRAKTLINRKLSYVGNIGNKFFNNIIVIILQHVIIWLGTIALYHHYLDVTPSIIELVGLVVLIPVVMFFDAIARSCANEVKKPFRVLARLSVNLFFALTVSIFSVWLVAT